MFVFRQSNMLRLLSCPFGWRQCRPKKYDIFSVYWNVSTGSFQNDSIVFYCRRLARPKSLAWTNETESRETNTVWRLCSTTIRSGKWRTSLDKDPVAIKLWISRLHVISKLLLVASGRKSAIFKNPAAISVIVCLFYAFPLLNRPPTCQRSIMSRQT